MSIKFTDEKGGTIKSGETVYLKLTVPEKMNMPVGRLDAIIRDLKKKGIVEILPEARIKDE